MFRNIRVGRSSSDEGEKPFWISYADLMTSLMVLFLLVMLASLVTLTRTVTDMQNAKSRSEQLAGRYTDLKRAQAKRRAREGGHRREIAMFWDELEHQGRPLGLRFDRRREVINFGDRARFQTGLDTLAARDQLLLRRFVPRLIALADSKRGRRVLNRVVIEGYADRRGSYLYNLNLSMNRSQRVLCSLLGSRGPASLGQTTKQRVRDLFLVGGVSFNDSRKSLAASRRVEMRLDFLQYRGKRAGGPRTSTNYGDCALS